MATVIFPTIFAAGYPALKHLRAENCSDAHPPMLGERFGRRRPACPIRNVARQLRIDRVFRSLTGKLREGRAALVERRVAKGGEVDETPTDRIGSQACIRR